MKTTNEARKELEKATTAERSAWGRECWLDCQARALCQAFYKLARALEA